MGVIVMAHLVFGVDFSEEDAIGGLPWCPESEVENDDYNVDGKPDFDEWAKALGYKTVGPDANCPIAELQYYTMEDGSEPALVVAVRSSMSQAEWRDVPPGNATKPKMTLQEEDIRAAQAFCAEYNIPFEEPSWLLVAEYIQ